MKNIAALILAAGEGTRMNSDLPKVLHRLCDRPMIRYVFDILRDAEISNVIVVVNKKNEELRLALKGLKLIFQKKPLGTADAVLAAKRYLLKQKPIDNILVIYGDMPLIKAGTIKKLINYHSQTDASCTLLVANLKNPTGYGRIIRNANDRIVRIVEEEDASIYDKVRDEVNVGVYCFKKENLFKILEEIQPTNIKKEYYLTDIVSHLSKNNSKIESVSIDDPDEALGINTRDELIRAQKILQERILKFLLQNGVTLIDPSNTYISFGVEIGRDTVIYPNTIIEEDVKIGQDCRIGPFARIRSGTRIGNEVVIGNFAEVVRSIIRDRTNLRHQCYIGDAEVGKDVNIGAGTIVANYDGKKKHKTIIEEGSFIGSGTILIAPCKIGRKAVTGAGAVVTKNKVVKEGEVVVGVPARVLKKRKK